MNEEALQDSFKMFSSQGYNGSIEDYKQLMSSNEEALQDSFGIFSSEGYDGSIEDYSELIGASKKKADSTLETEDTDGTTEAPGEITLSEFSEDLFDYDSILDSTEEDALPKVESLLADKGYSVEETGVGNALLITDNISRESTEIDLKPIFGKDKQIKKLRDILETPTDERRSLISTLNLKDYKRSGSYKGGRNAYVSSLQDQFPGFNFETLEEAGRLKISKGDSEVVINTKEGYNDAYQFSEINKFINDNLSDDEVSQVSADFEKKIYDQTISDLDKIKDEVDVSVESVKGEFMSGKYFGGLFDFLEEKGIDTSSIPEQEKQRLIRGVKDTGGINPVSGTTITVPLENEDVVKNLDTYFSDNTGIQAAVEFYNTINTTEKRKQAIERATKLKIENYYENSPNRAKVKNIVLKEFGKLTEQESDIYANVKLAQNELKGMTESVKSDMKTLSEKNPGVAFSIEEVDGKLSVVSSDKNVDVSNIENKIANSLVTYDDLLKKSKTDLEKVTANISNTKEYRDASKRNYNLIDQAYADFKSAVTNMGASGSIIAGLVKETVGDVIGSDTLEAQGATEVLLSRGAMAESRENVDKYFETKRTYNEAFKEGTTGSFSVRTFAEQAPNIALAVGTSGAGNAMGLSEAAVSTLIASQFGLTSSGGKYDELTTRQEASALAKKGLEELKSIKGEIPDEEYFKQKYELERAIKDGDISAEDKALSVIGTGLIEGIVTRYIGTVPNSVKVLKDLKGPSKFMDDILSSNYRAAGKAVKEFGKRTGGEIIEEGSIEALNQINDYLTIGDDMDFSQLDDVAVTSIITSGSMNAPSVAYSGIVSQINTNRYKSKLNSITGAIDSFKKILQEPGLTQSQRSSLHDNISKLVSSAADVTSNMEADAMLLGSDNIKELLTLSGVKKSLLDKAGVMPDDSYDIANAKIDNYLGGLNKKDKKDFSDKLKFVSDRQNEIVGSIDYTKAIEKTFGNKGVEIEKTLDPDLSSQEKYVEVYKQIRTEINEDAKKEYDAIQKQETREVPDAEPAEGVQEVETEVRVTPEQETEVESPIKDNLQENETIVQTRKDDKGRVFTTTKQESVRERDGMKVTKIKFNRSDKATDQRNDSFVSEEAALADTNYEINPEDRLEQEEGETATYEITEIREGDTGADASVKITTIDADGNQIGSFQGDVTLVEKTDESEQTVSEIDEVTVTEDKVVPAGKRLFNKPNPETTEISKKYKKDRNDETPEGEPITSIDKDNSREIADVYESLEDSPNDPKVQEAYLLMADETAEQYKEITDAGYKVEIWKGKGDPYANAQEMIDDVRENKHMWIFSTESGFGDTEITEEQRQQNKLLQDSGSKDKNGDTLLYNDLFRFVHDFFGHTERGNGFGPVGEENAWDVHSRMYTPLARRAMTTETRGQNSWVNFGPQMRNDKGELIKKGEEGYIIPKERAFAPQKMALMPEKYSELLPEGEVDSGDKKVAPSKTPATKDKAPSTKKVEASVSNISKEFKSGKPSMEEVYNKAEDLGIPLKEAREYLEEIGYTEKEIKDFVIKREDMSVKRDVAGEKNIFVKGKNITLNFLDTIKRQAASAKSYMPKNAFIAKEIKNAHIQSEIKVAERIAKRLNKMLKGQPDSVYDEVNKLMRGEEADLPKKIALIATAMRNHIDSLSEKLVMSGAVESEGAAANIMSNIGTYMNRSYRLFDDKNYADNISEEVILEAKEFLKAQELNRIIKEAAKENITPQEYVKKQKGSKNFTVEQYVDAKSDQSVGRIINKNEANAFVSAVSNEAKKDTKIFKERKEIPAEIRALMGEYTDAAYNYVMSVGKVKAIIETQKYLEKLKDIGDGVFLFEDGDIRIPDTGYTKIAAETNQSLAPLNGYYAPTELVNQMNSGPLNAKGLGEFWQKAFEVYMKGIGAVKYTKTILSVGTHFKNVLGNAYFMAQNGYFNPKDYNEAYKVLKNEFKNLDNEQLNKKLDEYIKAGIINQGVSLREVQGLLEGEQDFDVTIEKRTAERSENKIKKAAKNLGKNLEELYQAEDDLFKIVAYENEKRDYAKIDFDKKYEELSEKEKAKVDSKVAEIVKNILPNYSRLGNISKILRVAPVATFISFQLEAYRTAANTLDLSLKEVKSKNPRKRKKGAKRLTSLIGFQALKYSVLGMLGNYLLGDDDEDEEESKIQEVLEGSIGLSKPKTSVMEARPYLPFWSQNSDILITKAGNGEFSYIDMSASDPYGGLAKVVRAAQRSETIEEGIIYAAEELMSPIISTDILSGTIASLLRNEDVYGKKIWEKTDSPDDRAIKMIDAIYKTLEPGTLTSLRKIAGMNTPGKAYTDYGRYVTKMMDKDNRVAEAIGQVTGFKKNDVDVEMKMNYLLGDLKEDMKPIEIKKYIAKKRIETTGDAREYIKLIKSEHPDKYEIYKEASEIVKGAQKFGLSIEKIYPILRSKFPNGDDADIIFLFDQIRDQIIPKDE